MSDGLVLLRADRHRRMPWKNGGGVTTEIWAEPEGCSLEAFDWRLSMADVAADGPFSIFPGIDRTLAVIDGAGIALDIEHGGTLLAGRDGTPVTFSGDLPMHGRLTDGPIRDLNLMTRRGRLLSGMHRIEPTPGQAIELEAAVCVLLCLRGNAGVATGSEAFALGPDDVLLKRGTGTIRAQITAAGAGTVLYEIVIDPA